VTPKVFLSVRLWRGGELDRGLVVATRRSKACQRTVPMWRWARQLEARRRRTRCQQGRRKQRRYTRRCRLVLGTDNVVVQQR
jgi:hypothetical protein